MTKAGAPSPYADLEDRARFGRWLVMKTVTGSGAGHIGGPMSAMELLVALYFRVLSIRAEEPDWGDRDRFILSKGHSAVGLYAVMAQRGYFPIEELATFDKGDSRLQGHPDMTRLPGLDASTGSLGQGLAVGVGIALGARLRGRDFRTWVMLGDGECQEGMVWESAQVAARYGLGNLIAIVDHNGLQQYGWPLGDEPDARGDRSEPFPGRHAARHVRGIRLARGRDRRPRFRGDHRCLCSGRRGAAGSRPTAILARTIKGRGLSFSEGRHAWHARVPTADELEASRLELGIDDSGRLE